MNIGLYLIYGPNMNIGLYLIYGPNMGYILYMGKYEYRFISYIWAK